MPDFDLVSELRKLRRDRVHGMGSEGKAGVAPHLLWQAVAQRVNIENVLRKITDARAEGKIIILGKQGFHEGRGPLVVVERSLDEGFLTSTLRWRWNAGEYLHYVRIYVLPDGLPASIARKGVVKRALARQNSGSRQAVQSL